MRLTLNHHQNYGRYGRGYLQVLEDMVVLYR